MRSCVSRGGEYVDVGLPGCNMGTCRQIGTFRGNILSSGSHEDRGSTFLRNLCTLFILSSVLILYFLLHLLVPRPSSSSSSYHHHRHENLRCHKCPLDYWHKWNRNLWATLLVVESGTEVTLRPAWSWSNRKSGRNSDGSEVLAN
jgi:hypothetical protein